jgi:hypothetical protein
LSGSHQWLEALERIRQLKDVDDVIAGHSPVAPRVWTLVERHDQLIRGRAPVADAVAARRLGATDPRNRAPVDRLGRSPSMDLRRCQRERTRPSERALVLASLSLATSEFVITPQS